MNLILKGLGVSKGKVKARVKVIKDRNDFNKFQEGDILVTHLTDPAMVSLMSKASGIICNIGSITSHPSIISREMGIPCIVAAKDATSILKDNDLVHMCGESGEIHLVDDISKSWKLRW